MRTIFIVIVFWALLLCVPLFLFAHNTFPRLDSDYDSNLPIYQYMASYIKGYHSFPFLIPVNGEISVLGDPLNSFLNPLLSFPIIIFGINYGIRLSIFFSCIASGIAMYYFLKKNSLQEEVSLWGSFLYMGGGAFFAAVASGHIEKFLIYPLVPLLLLFSLHEKISAKNIFGISLVFAMSVYSGDFYATWFFFLLFLSVRGFYFFVSRNKWTQIVFFTVPIFLFIGLAMPKLYFFFRDVMPILERFSEIDPYKGSLHVFFFPLPFIIPFGVWFWDRPFFQKNLGFYFNWYEYFAFISPLPFIFFLALRRVWVNKTAQILIVVILMGAVYFSLAYPYSPFFWLFNFSPIAHFVRVPQRIVLPITAPLIALIALCLQILKRKKVFPMITKFIMAFSLLWVLIVDWGILMATFVAIPKDEVAFAKRVAELDTKRLPVTNYSAASQYLLIEEGIPINNFYYGWIPKVKSQKNMFILSQKDMYGQLDGYTKVFEDNSRVIWKKE